jgi:hypothetical protein
MILSALAAMPVMWGMEEQMQDLLLTAKHLKHSDDMMDAIERDSLDRIQALLATDANPSSYVFGLGYTAVGAALEMYLSREYIWSPDIIRTLLAAGFDHEVFSYESYYWDSKKLIAAKKKLNLDEFLDHCTKSKFWGYREYPLFKLFCEYSDPEAFQCDKALDLYSSILGDTSLSPTLFIDSDENRRLKIALLGTNLFDKRSKQIHTRMLSKLSDEAQNTVAKNIQKHFTTLRDLDNGIKKELDEQENSYLNSLISQEKMPYHKKISLVKVLSNAQINGRILPQYGKHNSIYYGGRTYLLSAKPHRYSSVANISDDRRISLTFILPHVHKL